MFIAPNTIIRILNNVRLTPDYQHSIYWGSYGDDTAKQTQTNYFINKTKYTLTQQSYQRQSKGIMRVEIPVESLYDCSYLMFQNSAFGNKWFYAFITNVEYVNNVTSSITYEIDVLQTWYFDYYVAPSYVEREHSSNDAVARNLVPENLDKGELVYIPYTHEPAFDRFKVVVETSFEYDATQLPPTINTRNISPEYYNGVPAMTNLYEFSDMYDLQQFVNYVAIAGATAGILSAYVVPYNITLNGSSDQQATWTYDTTYNVSYNNLGGYVPKNNKLFTYPYNFIVVDDNNGNRNTYRYEHFSLGATSITFRLYASAGGGFEMAIVPMSYNQSDATRWNRTTGMYENRGAVINKMVLSSFPEVAVATDTYKAWKAMHSNQLMFNYARGGIDTGIGLIKSILGGVFATHNAATGGTQGGFNRALGMAGGGLSQMRGGLETIFGQIAQEEDMKVLPQTVQGQQGINVNLATGIFGFRIYRAMVRPEEAKIIDDYFSLYGYATHKVKTPNQHVRQNWTYTKTVGAHIIGNMPADDKAVIADIFDKGITWWSNGDNLGNYGDMTNPVL